MCLGDLLNEICLLHYGCLLCAFFVDQRTTHTRRVQTASIIFASNGGAGLTSMMLSHSMSASTPVTSITDPDVPERSMLSKPAVVPELVQVVTRTSSTYTSTVLTLVAPLYSADAV